MVNGWTENGPVSLPPRWQAYVAGAVVAALAALGVAVGMRAAWRDAGAPDIGEAADSAADHDALIAKPIVQAPPPVTVPDADADQAKQDAADAEQAKADALAAKAAAAQAIQAKPSKAPGDIDDILTSPSEKPPAAAKPATDEAPPPGAPVKTDVPF
jgi:hypothetical protein